MTLATLLLGSPAWLWPAVVLAVVVLCLLLWSYGRGSGPSWLRWLAPMLKAAGVILILFCLIEPLVSGRRPRPGANLFVVLVDDSQSMQIHDPSARQSRADQVKARLAPDAAWQTRLSQDFQVRRYAFADRLRSLDDDGAEGSLKGDGQASSLVSALSTLTDRFQGQPVAGVLLLTDGNATDLSERAGQWSKLPPVYTVPIGATKPAPDVRLGDVAVTQTNFEQAPVTIKAEVAASGYTNRSLVVQLLNADGEEVDQASIENTEETQPRVVRFRVRPETAETSFYQLRVFAEGEGDAFELPENSREATLKNNEKWVAVDRPAGPYRVLYVSGRPNWEFKFLRRAVQKDAEVELVGLVRIAKREPKFSYLSRSGESTNPLYRGFEPEDSESAEQYDEPVIVRLGTRDDAELRSGFPQTAEELYTYHAIILDDLESEFFTQDQLLLLQKFVSTRGGGFLMLGGVESFFKGDYRRTAVGDMLPVYLDRQTPPPAETGYRLRLTREGWLQPWVRLRETEQEELQRLRTMPGFQVLNRSSGLKPGAQVLASVTVEDGQIQPALVAQRFGKGRAASLLIGDMWRWGLRREKDAEDDLGKAWRQTVRWLVGDVPGRVSLTTHRTDRQANSPVELRVEVRGPEYEPLDNASVEFNVVSPDGEKFRLRGEASRTDAGVYQAGFLPRDPGAYRVQAIVSDVDGSDVGRQQTGWTAEPAAEEFRRLVPDRELLGRIAEQSGGELVDFDRLESFVASLPNRKIPITEPWIYPLWQKPWLFLFAITCLVGEWGLRRWKGLP